MVTDYDDLTELPTLDGLKINLYYSNDNISFIPINNAQNLDPELISSGCTLDSSEEILPDSVSWTGCYSWYLPSNLLNKITFIRVEVIDSDGLGASALAPPLNAGNLSIIAGDIDKGIGGQARSAMFSMPANSKSDRGGWSFPDSFIVDSRGVTYFLDSEMGILKIDPADGIIQLLIGIDENIWVPTLGSDPVNISDATLRYPITIYLDGEENLLVFDNKHLRKINLENDTIETFLGSGGEVSIRTLNPEGCAGFAGQNCGYTYTKEKFGFEYLTSDHRPNINANLRTIIPLPRGDILFDFHGFSQKRQANWSSYLDSNVSGGVYNTFPGNNQGMSAESHSGLWWYRPRSFNDPQSTWGFYPIKFTDGGNACINHGFTAAYYSDPEHPKYGEIERIYAMLFQECKLDDQDIGYTMLEFDPAPLYQTVEIPEPQNGVTVLPWRKLPATNTPPYFGNNGVNSHYTSTSVGRNGVPFIFNRASGRAWEARRYDSDGNPLSRTTPTYFLGNSIGSTCVDGTLSTESECNIELLDLFVSSDGTIYFWDLSQIKMLTGELYNFEVSTVFGKPADHGDGYLSTSARFSYISDFGLYGKDINDDPTKENLMIMDVYSRKFRKVIDGEINSHFGAGVYGFKQVIKF